MITGVMIFIFGLWGFVLVVLAYTWVSRMKRGIKQRINLEKKSHKPIEGLVSTKCERGLISIAEDNPFLLPSRRRMYEPSE